MLLHTSLTTTYVNIVVAFNPSARGQLKYEKQCVLFTSVQSSSVFYVGGEKGRRSEFLYFPPMKSYLNMHT